jgi:DNA-binding protein
MTQRKTMLSAAAMEKLLKKAGAERVSEGAKKELIEFLEEIALEIGEKALRLSHHAGRKTIKAVDIKEATK